MFRRLPPTPGERFSSAYSQAYQAAKSHQNIRWNTMSAHGDVAMQLAEIGAIALNRSVGDDTFEHDDWVPDYVANGTNLSFNMLRRVIVPASRLAGANCFSVEPCDADGNMLTAATSNHSDSFKLAVARRRTIWLGEDREDYWRATAAGIATEISQMDVSPKKALRIAEAKAIEGSGEYADRMLATTAETTLSAVLATQHAQQGEFVLQALHVCVEPISKVVDLL